jgi:hypothetical protein
MNLKALGYDVLLLGDSDEPITPSAEELTKAGIAVVLWGDNMSIEQRLSIDTPWSGVLSLLEVAAVRLTPESIRTQVQSECGAEAPMLSDVFGGWTDTPELRLAIGRAAKSKKKANGKEKPGWFKSVTAGEQLGEVLAGHLEQIEGTDVAKKLALVRKWIDSHG